MSEGGWRESGFEAEDEEKMTKEARIADDHDKGLGEGQSRGRERESRRGR